MTIPYQIQVCGPLQTHQKQKIENIIDDTFTFVDEHYNPWNPYSEISKLNNLKAFESSPLSCALEEILNETKDIVELSDGLFDPSIQAMQKLWKEALKSKKIPSKEEIENVKKSMGWEKIHIDGHKFSKDDSDLEIDLCGIAKGKCVDLLAQNLEKAGFKNFFIEWGGEILAKGKHPQNRPWTVLITNPFQNSDQKEFVFLDGTAIAGSGNYYQQWKFEGQTFTHILHPKRLSPLRVSEQSILSTHVQAPSCALADALATTLMLFDSKEQAMSWWAKAQKKFPEARCWIHSNES